MFKATCTSNITSVKIPFFLNNGLIWFDKSWLSIYKRDFDAEATKLDALKKMLVVVFQAFFAINI